MRIALRNELDISLRTEEDGRWYQVRVSGLGVRAVLERRGTTLERLDVGDRARPALAREC
jgi:hypothetical protein